jgi:hypothetical protein
MLVRGRSLWKNGNAAAFLFWLWISVFSSFMHESLPLAAAERQERSD